MNIPKPPPSFIIGAIILLLLPIQAKFDLKVDATIIAIGYLAIFLAVIRMGLSIQELGLSRAQLKRSIKISAFIAVVIFIAVGAAYLIRTDLFKDERYNKTLLSALAYALLILPVKTIFIEELLFRGLAQGYFDKIYSFKSAAIITSVLFGLWHIIPSINDQNDPFFTVFTVIVTFTAGMILSLLKKRYDSLLVPIVTHWAINGSAIIFASFAWN